jgi:hypothetical protein
MRRRGKLSVRRGCHCLCADGVALHDHNTALNMLHRAEVAYQVARSA